MTSSLPDSAALITLSRHLKAGGYRFITPTPLTHRHVNEREANRTASTLRDVFGWSRLIPESLMPASEAEGLRDAGILERYEASLKSRVRFSSLDDLLLVHSAFPTTDEDSVFFGPDTYRFAQSISRHLQSTTHPIDRAVDIGCGTGAGAMLVAKARPQAQVYAVDINPRALHFAQVNATCAGLDNMDCRHSDILANVEGSFDLIVANPPYMKDNQRRAYRHGGDALGADLSVRIVHESLDRLTPGGSLVLYTGVAMVGERDPFFAAVHGDIDHKALAWTYRELDPDVFGEELLEDGYEDVDRIAAVELIVTRRT
ncbi:class I SAM-dependent methyltransferase [Pseudomonas sp. CDFA 602]|uniref:N5-glutamine methyltransferase family protein n=1 Tax=Pseudomonas californiensis TaxID=2829823 RepID=UPI001E57BDAF|nr:class I SAM-dependent methyltransferase [Pseudomonas californiensis]MCD5995447.1 class I SAM-dependent methyltransferase [Pseudomonas californiensis]MCD6000957.1 class I SAM-dependent methyltransferase [Pseudomonas californiensis]